jgi:MFS family permease
MGHTTHVLVLAGLTMAFGFCSIAPAPISSILIMETLPQKQWDGAFGRFNMLGGWGWIAGLLLGLGVLPLLEWMSTPALSLRLAMWGLAALMLVTAWWAWHTIPQPKYRVTRQQFVTVTQRLPRLAMVERVLYLPRRLLFVLHPAHLRDMQSWASPLFLRYLVATGLMFISFITALVPFPLFLQEAYGMGTMPIFALVLVRAVAAAPFYTWSGRCIPRLGAYRMQQWTLLGRCVAFGGLGCLWLVESYPLTVLLLVSFNLLIGITWSGIAVAGPSGVSLLAKPSHSGKAMGCYNAVQGVAQILGAIVGGCLAHWVGYSSTFVVAGFCLLPAIALLVSLELQYQSTNPAAQSPSLSAA